MVMPVTKAPSYARPNIAAGTAASSLSYEVYSPGEAMRPRAPTRTGTNARGPSLSLAAIICLVLLGVCVGVGTVVLIIAGTTDDKATSTSTSPSTHLPEGFPPPPSLPQSTDPTPPTDPPPPPAPPTAAPSVIEYPEPAAERPSAPAKGPSTPPPRARPATPPKPISATAQATSTGNTFTPPPNPYLRPAGPTKK
ncbi:MAG: hypothetical protein FWD73_10460 [Polyangiaceae bacterium]|nr:hypothetical protein [Polyangiaceae bacterium]